MPQWHRESVGQAVRALALSGERTTGLLAACWMDDKVVGRLTPVRLWVITLPRERVVLSTAYQAIARGGKRVRVGTLIHPGLFVRTFCQY